MTRLLVIDTEASGPDPTVHSILSFAGLVWEDGREGDALSLLINEPPLSYAATASTIHGIDPLAIRKYGRSPSDAVAILNAYCEREFHYLSAETRVVLVGHNVGFDVAFLKRLYRLAGRSYDSVFSHRVVDTASIMRFLMMLDILDLSEPTSESAFRHFGIMPPDQARHTAMGDAQAAFQLFNCLIDLTRKHLRPGESAKRRPGDAAP